MVRACRSCIGLVCVSCCPARGAPGTRTRSAWIGGSKTRTMALSQSFNAGAAAGRARSSSQSGWTSRERRRPDSGASGGWSGRGASGHAWTAGGAHVRKHVPRDVEEWPLDPRSWKAECVATGRRLVGEGTWSIGQVPLLCPVGNGGRAGGGARRARNEPGARGSLPERPQAAHRARAEGPP